MALKDIADFLQAQFPATKEPQFVFPGSAQIKSVLQGTLDTLSSRTSGIDQLAKSITSPATAGAAGGPTDLLSLLNTATSGSGSSGGGIGVSLPSFNPVVSPQDFLNSANSGQLVPQDYATLVGGMQYDPQISAVQRNIGTSQTQADRQLKNISEQLGLGVNTQQNYGAIGDQRLQDIYSALGGQLQANQGKLQGIYQGGIGGVQDVYKQGMTDIAGQGNDLINRLQASAGKLGLDAALPDVTGKVADETGTTLARFGTAGQGAGQSLGNLGTDILGIGQSAVGASQQEGAQKRSDLVTGVQNSISQLQVGAATESRDIRDKLGDTVSELEAQLTDLGSAKGQAVRLAYDQALQAKSDRERQSKLDALNAQVQQAGLELQRAQLGLEAQKANAAASSQTDPLDQILKMAQIQNYQSEITNRDQPKNIDALTQYISDNSLGPRAQGAIYQAISTPDADIARSVAAQLASEQNLDPRMILGAVAKYFAK